MYLCADMATSEAALRGGFEFASQSDQCYYFASSFVGATGGSMDSAEKVLNAILEDIEFRKDFLSDRARVISELNVSDAEKEALKSLDVRAICGRCWLGGRSSAGNRTHLG